MARCVAWGFSGGGARMPARSVRLVTLSLPEAGPGRLGGQVSVTDINHTTNTRAQPRRRPQSSQQQPLISLSAPEAPAAKFHGNSHDIASVRYKS